MNIAVIGLGLIGGSFCKAIKKHTHHTVFGFDKSAEVCDIAHSTGAVDAVLCDEDIASIDLFIVALYPKDAISYVTAIAPKIKTGALVCDCGGVKRDVCDKLLPVAKAHGFTFIGAHPMAGREKSGFLASSDDLFFGASLIVMERLPEAIEALFYSLGFSRLTLSTPKEHDEIIAFTSQLAHVVSSAYVRSPLSLSHAGFSAGSFKDMTRVAYLNEIMWTELFLENADALSNQTRELAKRLLEYADAIEARDADKLMKMLCDGKEKKVLSDALEDTK